MDCFDCIVKSTFSLFDTNVLTGFMISLLVPLPAPSVRKARKLIGKSVQNGLRFFLLFWKKYFFIQKLNFLINNLFRNVFRTSVVIGIITLCKTLTLKKYLNSWKTYFLAGYCIENEVVTIPTLFPSFSVCSYSN